MFEPKAFTDQMGRKVNIPFPPRRIISLVPSQTELLYALGLGKELVGQTLFCIHPAEFHQTRPRVGGTKNLNLEKIRELKPDLIIGNKEENDQTQIETLAKEFPVWMSDIQNLEQALDMIEQLGLLTQRGEEAKGISSKIILGFNELTKVKLENKSCLYFIWREPFMVAGSNTFIEDMLQRCGLENLATPFAGRYPTLELGQIKGLYPDVILLSSEPYPFKQSHLDDLQSLCPNSKIVLADGEMFSWYGSRLLKSPGYFLSLLKDLV